MYSVTSTFKNNLGKYYSEANCSCTLLHTITAILNSDNVVSTTKDTGQQKHDSAPDRGLREGQLQDLHVNLFPGRKHTTVQWTLLKTPS